MPTCNSHTTCSSYFETRSVIPTGCHTPAAIAGSKLQFLNTTSVGSLHFKFWVDFQLNSIRRNLQFSACLMSGLKARRRDFWAKIGLLTKTGASHAGLKKGSFSSIISCYIHYVQHPSKTLQINNV